VATLASSVRAIESLLGGGGGQPGGWPVRFAAAAEAANRHLTPEQLARVIIELSDEAWAELRSLRETVGETLRAAGPSQTAFGQLLRVEDRVWETIDRLRAECRGGSARDAGIHAVALGAIRAAVTPPRQQKITSAARAERRDGDDPRMADADEAVAKARGRAFLENYRRLRAAAAEQRPELRTQKGLAAAAGLSPATINAIETGKVVPHLGTILKLARALGVPAEELMRGR
jgi:DNA-binding XRE family transcriptional regulator